MKKQKLNSKLITGGVLGVLVLFVVAGVSGLTFSVSKMREVVIAGEPEAVLASAGVTDGADISLPVTYLDQRQDECANIYDDVNNAEGRQFEWTSCGYDYQGVERGIVGAVLSDDYLPIAEGGKMVTNRGVTDISRWVESVEGKSQEYTGTINLKYRSVFGTPEFSYANEEFYPLDDAGFSDGDSANRDGHNHLFTMNFAVPFTVRANGREKFEITADDDTFVFVGDRLALDMGGIHAPTTGRFEITESGEVYTGVGDEDLAYSGIRLNENGIVRIFHADRNSESSEFKVRFFGMLLNVTKSEFAGADTGVQIAYNPSDPGFVAPLGESKTFQPNSTRGYVITATVFGMVVVVMSVLVAMTIKRMFFANSSNSSAQEEIEE